MAHGACGFQGSLLPDGGFLFRLYAVHRNMDLRQIIAGIIHKEAIGPAGIWGFKTLGIGCGKFSIFPGRIVDDALLDRVRTIRDQTGRHVDHRGPRNILRPHREHHHGGIAA